MNVAHFLETSARRTPTALVRGPAPPRGADREAGRAALALPVSGGSVPPEFVLAYYACQKSA
jgi:hypothetical protein